MQKETVSLTLDVSINEAHSILTFLHDIRSGEGCDPAYYESHTLDGVKAAIVGIPQAAPQTVPIKDLTAPDYQPPQTPLAAQPQPAPAPAPAWQPPQAPLAAQPQAPLPPTMPPQWQQQPVAPIPTAAPAYTLDQLATAAAPLMDAGKGPELVAMLATFGVASLNSLPPDRYADCALNLRAMGAVL